ncbi:MAG: hypothetical protein AVO39_06415 [delta proteobacterium MLS_D]|jgi:phage shock protein C|nr:MAG: hypothetical protein AVO39_06415 [delta proteobacterium MLS_D]
MFEWLQNLTKSEHDRWLGGVCGGLGEHSPVPSWVWRVLTVLLALAWGFGLVLYVLLWIFMPRPPAAGTGDTAGQPTEES